MEAIGEFFHKLFENPITDLTPFELAIFAALCVLAFFLLKWLLKILWAGIKGLFKGIGGALSSKKKCQQIQCPHCGRTLDKCICEDNHDRGYTSRLFHYRKEKRRREKAAKKK